jgi:hypothetical protein
VFPFSTRSGAGVGAFIRDFLRTLAGERREFGVYETRGAAIVLPIERDEPALEPAPTPVVAARRSGRLIDLERRAKFGQFRS